MKQQHHVIVICVTEEDSTEVLEETYYQLASYGDKLYRQLHQYLESDAIQTKRSNITRSMEEVERLEDLARKCSDLIERKELARLVHCHIIILVHVLCL